MTVSALEQLLGNKLLHNESLAKYTAARIGGPAEYLYVANETVKLLAEVVQIAWNADSPVRVLGGGANVLISDKGVRGLVVINRVKQTVFEGNCVQVTGGVSLTNLANQCAKHGLTGFEWAISVPGTVGGAVVNNAGAHDGDMNDSLVSVDVVDAIDGRQLLTLDEMAYDYRTSALKSRLDRRFLVLEAQLQFEQDDPDAIRARMDEFRAHRKRTQPPGASLGSIFKNPEGDYAGRLIEAAGLKGYTIGNAAVSDVHANFFINTGTPPPPTTTR
jgi:UDP-N-acetylmuramate dehydrogenase